MTSVLRYGKQSTTHCTYAASRRHRQPSSPRTESNGTNYKRLSRFRIADQWAWGERSVGPAGRGLRPIQYPIGSSAGSRLRGGYHSSCTSSRSLPSPRRPCHLRQWGLTCTLVVPASVAWDQNFIQGHVNSSVLPEPEKLRIGPSILCQRHTRPMEAVSSIRRQPWEEGRGPCKNAGP